jgi:hypothetical protein
MDIGTFFTEHWAWVTAAPVAFVVWTLLAISVTVAITRALLGAALETSRERLEGAKDENRRLKGEKSDLMQRLERYGDNVDRVEAAMTASPHVPVSKRGTLDGEDTEGAVEEVETSPSNPETEVPDIDPADAAPEALPPHIGSAELFSYRISDAFPGIRGTEELNGPEAADRLDVLLRAPLHRLRKDDFGEMYANHPFWWFRGGANMHIVEYERLEPGKVLINIDELRVRRVVAVREFSVPERDFVYVEVEADQPVGIYSYAEGDIERRLQKSVASYRGYYVAEEYGLWNGRLLTREEYDDGGAVVDGKPVRTIGSELRVRYLTPYNLILCGNHHVINHNKFDEDTAGLLDGILRGEEDVPALIEYVRRLPRPPRFQPGD